MKLLSLLVGICIALNPMPLFAASDLESGVKELAVQISNNMRSHNKKKIAVIEFSNLNDEISEFGQFLSEELITQLFLENPNAFEVVERRQLLKILNEQDLGTSGLLDSDAMGKVGKILGLDAIVTGSITDLGNTVKINARLIAVDTAKIFAVAFSNIPKVGTVASLMGRKLSPDKNQRKSSSKISKKKTSILERNDFQHQTEVNGLLVSLDKCKLSGSRIACEFLITSKKTDKNITVYAWGKSRLIDQNGEESLATTVSIGKRSTTQYFDHTFVSGIPIRASLNFENVANVNNIPLLEFAFAKPGTRFTAQFRGVSLNN